MKQKRISLETPNQLDTPIRTKGINSYIEKEKAPLEHQQSPNQSLSSFQGRRIHLVDLKNLHMNYVLLYSLSSTADWS